LGISVIGFAGIPGVAVDFLAISNEGLNEAAGAAIEERSQ
jgi:hypothetical protein